ncbi:unnamed protein product [Caenorhabditis nigoni]
MDKILKHLLDISECSNPTVCLFESIEYINNSFTYQEKKELFDTLLAREMKAKISELFKKQDQNSGN